MSGEEESISALLERVVESWSQPRARTPAGDPTSLRLRCSIQRTPGVEAAKLPNAPPSVQELWAHAAESRLFEDVDYGQWGLVLHGPESSLRLTKRFLAERAEDAVEGDLVVGEFLGDSDLLLVRGDPLAKDFGQVIVAFPLDPRGDWVVVGSDLRTFLRTFILGDGEKFWER